MIKVNLLDVKEKKKFKLIYLEILVFISVVIGLIVVIFFTTASINSKIAALKADIEVSNSDIRKLEKVLKEVDGFKARKAEIQKKIDVVRKLKMNQRGYYKLLTTLESNMPEDLWITSLIYFSDNITLQGSSLRSSSINDFISKVEGGGVLSKIDLKMVKKVNIQQIDVNDFMFTANINLGGQNVKQP